MISVCGQCSAPRRRQEGFLSLERVNCVVFVKILESSSLQVPSRLFLALASK